MNWEEIKAMLATAAPIAATVAGAGAVAVEAGKGIGAIQKHMQIADTGKHLVDVNPELADYDQQKVKDYFNVVKMYSPQAARNALVAGSLVNKMIQFGGVDHKLVQDISSLEKNQNGFGEGLSNIMKWKAPEFAGSSSDLQDGIDSLASKNRSLMAENYQLKSDNKELDYQNQILAGQS